MNTEQGSTLPENVGAIMHPESNNYVMFTTFRGDGTVGDDLLSSTYYPEALKKLITVMDYQYFKAIKDSSNLKDGTMPFFVPQTMVYHEDLPKGWNEFVDHFCERYDKEGEDDTVVLLRFFEYDAEDDSYYPVQVDIKNGTLEGAQPQANG